MFKFSRISDFGTVHEVQNLLVSWTQFLKNRLTFSVVKTIFFMIKMSFELSDCGESNELKMKLV